MLITFATDHQMVAVHLHDGVAHFVEFNSNASGYLPVHPSIEGPHKVKTLVLDSLKNHSYHYGYSDSSRSIAIIGWKECVRQAKETNTHLM